MFKTTRIAAVLAFAFVCVPAHALSMKDYEAKSDADKLRYLQTCVGYLIIDVAKTDRPLSLKIRSYYYDKLPGYPDRAVSAMLVPPSAATASASPVAVGLERITRAALGPPSIDLESSRETVQNHRRESQANALART